MRHYETTTESFIETYPNMDVIRTPHYNKLTYGHANYMPIIERGSAMVVEVIQPPPTRRRRGVCPFRLRPPLLRPLPPAPLPPPVHTVLERVAGGPTLGTTGPLLQIT